jgi:hypothetical protein
VFDPDVQRNQHYISVFWQKRFHSENNQQHCLKRNRIQQGRPRKQMAEDWIYTTFDSNWQPSNSLEVAFGKFETDASRIFKLIDDKNNSVSFMDQCLLRWFISFSICRHPDAMSQGHRLGKKFANLLSFAPSQTLSEFLDSLSIFHFSEDEATVLYEICSKVPAELLEADAEEIMCMSPSDTRLPEQLSVDNETIERVLFLLGKHNLTVLDTPSDMSFILGDTPFPDVLAEEISIPISSKIALYWKSGATDLFPEWSRKFATREEVDSINQQQFDNSLEIVIGSSRETLKTISGHTLLAYPHKRIVGFSIIHLGSWRFFVRLDRFRKICTLAARYPS